MYSIHETVTLDLQAAPINMRRKDVFIANTFMCGKERMLKTAAIYGANASGKSSIVKSIDAALEIIRNSHNYNENTVFDYQPFKFAPEDEPSVFKIRFMLDAVEYEYGFTFNRHRILSEEMVYYPNTRRVLIFARKGNDYRFGKSLRRPVEIAINTSDRTLFLSRGSQMKRELLQRVFSFFVNDIVVVRSGFSLKGARDINSVAKETLLEVLRMADTDIVDYTIEQDAIYTRHRNNPAVRFNLASEESAGTRKLFDFALTMLNVIEGNKTLIVDEFDTNLHTLLAQAIVDAFHKSRSAQMVFVTHNTRLLSLNKFRRDQIYFVNKRSDGSTDLYSLYDYVDFDDRKDVEEAYLQGLLEGLPFPERFADAINSHH